jgi:hypothetical protein
MAIEDLPVFCYYDKQRFVQFGSMDCANWYGISVETGKKKNALYPCMGRKHVVSVGLNKLIFNEQPRVIFKTINFCYTVVGTQVIQFDSFYNLKVIGSVQLGTTIWFDYLTVGTTIYAMMTDEVNIYVITETATSVVMAPVTDTNAPGGSANPGSPMYVAAFGNRFVVSKKDTPEFYLSRINLFSDAPDAGDLSNCFTIDGAPLFAEASSVIRQLGVLHAQLYIFTDFTADIWANIITQIRVNNVIREFPWKINTSYNFDYGMANHFSLSIDFGRMVWLAKNNDGLVSFMVSTGQTPQNISSQAVNVLLEGSSEDEHNLSPFDLNDVNGFLYQWENTVIYRVSAGLYTGNGILDQNVNAQSLEYNFDTQTWTRAIELNGERNRIEKHVYFNFLHLVTVQGDAAVYQMSGSVYFNELLNPTRTSDQSPDAFNKYPFRYELVTEQLYLKDYAEFIDDYVEIDFVFGTDTAFKSLAPFLNTVFLVSEDSTPDAPEYLVAEDGTTFLIAEGSNTPSFDDNHYYALFKPHIELYYSDDGGVTFTSADLREFSPLGKYRWRMRWYELSVSRNRCYKLICISPSPIVVLGGVRNTRRASGGAN